MSTTLKILLGTAIVATLEMSTLALPVSAAEVDSECFGIEVSEESGEDLVTLEILNYDEMFDADGDIDRSHECFDIVHVDGLTLNGGACEEVPLHPDHYGSNWTDANVAQSFSWEQEVDDDSTPDLELFNHSNCTGDLGEYTVSL